MSRESEFGQEFRRIMRQGGAMIYPLIGSQHAPRGWPDVLVWHRLWDGLVELKGPETRVEAQQLSTLQRLHAIKPWSAVIYRQTMGTLKTGSIFWCDPRLSLHELELNGPTLAMAEVPVAEFLARMRERRSLQP